MLKNSFFVLCVLLLCGCKSTETKNKVNGFQGQGTNPIVSTHTKPIQKQWKGQWALNDSTVFFSNEFDGARLNGVVHDSLEHYTLLIAPENIPVNPSPWYAFKVWGTTPKEVTLRFTYQDSRSRYYPKISDDGIAFRTLDSTRFKIINQGVVEFGIKAAPEMIEIKVPISKKPIYVAAQELCTSARVEDWIDSLSVQSFVANYSIGKSIEGRNIRLMEIAEGKPKKALMVITRQHPPEVTGFLAMKSFVETLAGNAPLAKRFRRSFTIFSIPLVNPDGVDNGHWRHNMGGVDLNRDWQNFNQPETRAVRDFLAQKQEEGYTFEFGVDFHSTWDDIYYPLDSTVTGIRGKIVFDWIDRISSRLPSKKTNVKPSKRLYPTMVSGNHFYAKYNMPPLIFELGDNTPRSFIKEKGKVAAEELMRLLLNEP